MKKILSLSLILLPLTLIAQYNLNNAIKNTMTFYYSGYAEYGIRINTKIPILSNDNLIGSVQLEIYDAFYTNSVQTLQVGWAAENGHFGDIAASGTGSYLPEAVLVANDNGYVQIFIPGQFHNLIIHVNVILKSSLQQQDWLENWEAADAPVESNIVSQSNISSYFRTLGATAISTNDIYAYRINTYIANITNLTVSNTLSATDIEVKKTPALNQQEIARINLTNRNASNGFYSWGIYTGATAGGLGVTSNGLDIWEYPDWGNWTTGTTRQRFIMHPSQKNGVNDFKPFVINPNGSVAIGFDNGNIAKSVSMNNSSSGGYMLFVNGNVKAKKLRITTTASEWADYVFEPNYKLRSLQSLEKFINENKHLPDVPTAEEIGKEGQDVGSMQVILLKKIEELTLYLIQQNKQLEEQDKKIRELTSELLILKAAK